MSNRARRHGVVRVLWLALLPIASALSATPSAATDPPQALFKDLFIAVQTAQVFADGKAFPDAVPTTAPDDILRQFHAEHPDSAAALKNFVEAHFALPSEVMGASSPPNQISITAHIDGLWDA